MDALESADLYRSLLDQSPDGIVVVAPDGRFAHVNSRACELLGYEHHELIGLSMADVVDPDDSGRTPLRHAETEVAGTAIGNRVLVAKNGDRMMVEAHARRMRDGSQQIIWRDVTFRLQVEAEVRATQGVAKAVLERVSDAFVALDRDWRYTWVNERAGELLGRAPEELIGRHIWTVFPEGRGQPFHLMYEKALSEQVPIEFEDYYEPWDRWFENRIFPSSDGLTIYFHEITERKRAERALADSESRLRALFEQSHVPMCTVDLDGRHLSVNRAYCRLLERSAEELLGSSWEIAGHPDDLESVREADAALLTAHRQGTGALSYRVERRMLTPHGTTRWVDMSTTLLLDVAQQPLAYVDVLVDVTRQTAATEELSRVAERLRVLSDVAEATLGASTVEEVAGAALGRLRALVGAFAAVVSTVDGDGVTVVAVDGDRALPVRAGMRVPVTRQIDDLRRGELRVVPNVDTMSGELPETYELARAAGARALAIIPLHAESGLIGSLNLVTERESGFEDEALQIAVEAGRSLAVALQDARKNEELARYSEELAALVNERTALLQTVLDTTPDVIRAFALDGSTLFTNESCSRFWHDVLELEPHARFEEAAERMAALTANPARYQATTRLLAGDQELKASDEFELSASAQVFSRFSAPIREDGRPIGRLFVLRDVTSERQAERLKQELLATVSHEIRTPLTSIANIAELLKTREPDDDRRRWYYELLHTETTRLSAIVNEFLDLQRLERGHFEIHRQQFDLVELVTERLDVAQTSFPGHLFVVRAPEARVDVDADRARLGQVLANMLSNAGKYSPPGREVAIRVERTDGGAKVAVTDQGFGVEQHELGLVFSRFFRGAEARRRNTSGTGLGLAISRDIVEAHGGSMGFESVAGRGSSFWFELPLGAAL